MTNKKVLHFSEGFSMNEVNTVLSSRPDVIYYTRYIPENNEFHIVNKNNGSFSITPFVTQLFDFYKKNEKLSHILNESMVKGNDSFSIIVNSNEELVNQIKKDLNILLNK